MKDSLNEMLDDLRTKRPPIYDIERFASWGESIAQVIQAMPRFDQRWKAVALIAQEVSCAHDMPLSMAFRSLTRMMLSHADCERVSTLGTAREAR